MVGGGDGGHNNKPEKTVHTGGRLSRKREAASSQQLCDAGVGVCDVVAVSYAYVCMYVVVVLVVTSDNKPRNETKTSFLTTREKQE